MAAAASPGGVTLHVIVVRQLDATRAQLETGGPVAVDLFPVGIRSGAHIPHIVLTVDNGVGSAGDLGQEDRRCGLCPVDMEIAGLRDGRAVLEIGGDTVVTVRGTVDGLTLFEPDRVAGDRGDL